HDADNRATVKPPPPRQLMASFVFLVLTRSLTALIAEFFFNSGCSLIALLSNEVSFCASSGVIPSGKPSSVLSTRSPVVREIPPMSSPLITLERRGSVKRLNVSSTSSIVTQRRPIFWAAAAVVPDPPKISRTMSLGLVAMWIMRSRRRSGLGVEKADWPGKRARISLAAVSLCPTSFHFSRFRGAEPSLSDNHPFL